MKEQTNVSDWTEAQADAYIRKFESLESEFPCVHGHFGCATRERGPCVDEVLAYFPHAGEDHE